MGSADCPPDIESLHTHLTPQFVPSSTLYRMQETGGRIYEKNEKQFDVSFLSQDNLLHQVPCHKEAL